MTRNEWAKEARARIKQSGQTLGQFATSLLYSESHVNRVLCGYRSAHAEALISERLGMDPPEASAE